MAAKYTYLFQSPDDKKPAKDCLDRNEYITCKSIIIRDENIGKFILFESLQKYKDAYHIQTKNGLQKHLTHEVILSCQSQKPKFDIDGGTEEDHQYIVDMIYQCFIETYRLAPEAIIIPSINTKPEETKLSAHVVITNFCFTNTKEANHFTENILRPRLDEEKEFLDNINKTTQNYRLALTTNKKGRYLKYDIDNFDDTIITNCEGITKLPPMADYKTAIIPDGQGVEHTFDYMATIDKNAFVHRKTNNNMIIFDRINSSHCDICDRVHDSVGMYICVYSGSVTRHCFRSKQHKVLWTAAIEAAAAPVKSWFDIVKKYKEKKINIQTDVLIDQMRMDMIDIVKVYEEAGNSLVYLVCTDGSYKIQPYNRFMESVRHNIATSADGTKIKFSQIIEKFPDDFIYSSIVFDPSPNFDKSSHQINLFRGYKAKRVQTDISVIQLILDHIRVVLAAGDNNLYNYILDWFANILQTGRKNESVLVFKSDQGAGKNTIIDFMRDYVIGRDYQTDCNSLDELTGKFNSVFAHKVISCINEANTEGDASHYYKVFAKLKDLITNPMISMELKGIDTIKLDDYNNYIITTNNDRPIHIDRSDRRYTVIKCSDEKIGNLHYFNALHNILGKANGANTANHLYSFLMDRVITSNIKLPYETEMKKELINNIIDSVRDFSESTKYYDNTIERTKLWDDYVEFTKDDIRSRVQINILISKLTTLGFIIDSKKCNKRINGKQTSYIKYTIAQAFIAEDVNAIDV